MLLFLLLVFLPAVPIETEVVGTLTDCPGFFVEETPPEIPNILVGGNIQDQNRYKVICQTFENKRRFLTLYDTKNKIPAFSAYRFTGGQSGRPKGNLWKIEPQLDNDKNLKKLEDYNQALNSEYTKNLDYNRGHLYPNSHAPDLDAQVSTFTLTNVVPQSIPFNSGSWANMERCTKCYMEKNCINANGKIEAFVVTGAEPGNSKLNDKINIPSRMWSAFCCYNSRDGVWLSKAYWGDNVPDTCPNLEERSCEDLKDTFGIQIFPKRLCSFKKQKTKQRSKRMTFCTRSECECLLENSTTTAPPTTTDKTSEKTTFPPSTTTTVTTPQTTTTVTTTTKTTKSTTTTTTKSTTKKQKKDKKNNNNRNTGNKGGGGGGGGGGVGNIVATLGIFSTIIGGITGAMVSALSPVAGGIASGISSVAGGIASGISSVAGGIGGIAAPLAGGIGGVVGPVAGGIGGVAAPVAGGIGGVAAPVAGGIGSDITPLVSGFISAIISLFGGLFVGVDGDRERASSIINLKSTDPPSKTMKTMLTTPQTSITTTNLKTTSSASATQTTDGESTGNEYGKVIKKSSASFLTPTTKLSSPNQTPVSATARTTFLTTPQTPTTVLNTDENSTPVTQTEEDSTGNEYSTSLLNKGGKEGDGGERSFLSIFEIVYNAVGGVASGIGNFVGQVASEIGSGTATFVGRHSGGLIGGGGHGRTESPTINPKFTSTQRKR